MQGKLSGIMISEEERKRLEQEELNQAPPAAPPAPSVTPAFTPPPADNTIRTAGQREKETRSSEQLDSDTMYLPTKFAEGVWRTAEALAKIPVDLGATGLWKTHVYDEAKKTREYLEAQSTRESTVAKFLGGLASGMGAMSVELPLLSSWGKGIKIAAEAASPAVALLFNRASDFALGMSAQEYLKTWAETKDMGSSVKAAFEGLTTGQVMHVIPKGVVKGGAGWAAFGAASQAKQDLEQGELSPVGTYAFKVGESIGFHLIFSGTSALGKIAKTQDEQYIADVMNRSLERGKVRVDYLDHIEKDPAISAEFKEAASELRLEVVGAIREGKIKPQKEDPAVLENIKRNLLDAADQELVDQINGEIAAKESGIRPPSATPSQTYTVEQLKNYLKTASTDAASHPEGSSRQLWYKAEANHWEKLLKEKEAEGPSIGELIRAADPPAALYEPKQRGVEGKKQSAVGEIAHDALRQEVPPSRALTRAEMDQQMREFAAEVEAEYKAAIWETPEPGYRYEVGERVVNQQYKNFGVVQAVYELPKGGFEYDIKYTSPLSGKYIVKRHVGYDLGKLRANAHLERIVSDPNTPRDAATEARKNRTMAVVLKVREAVNNGKDFDPTEVAHPDRLGTVEDMIDIIDGIVKDGLAHEPETRSFLKDREKMARLTTEKKKREVWASMTEEERAKKGSKWREANRPDRNITDADFVSLPKLEDAAAAADRTAKSSVMIMTASKTSKAILMTLTARSLHPDATPQDIANLEKYAAYALRMQEIETGFFSDVGYALAAKGDRSNITVEDIMAASDLQGLRKLTVKVGAWPKMKGWVEVYKGWIFSNSATQLINLGGATAIGIMRVGEKYAEAIRGRGRPGRVGLHQANAFAFGEIMGAKYGVKYTGEIFKKAYGIAAEVGGQTQEGKADATTKAKVFESTLADSFLVPHKSKYGGSTRSFDFEKMGGVRKGGWTNVFADFIDMTGVLSRIPLNALGVVDNLAARYPGYYAKISEIAYVESFKQLNKTNGEALNEGERKTFIQGFLKAHQLFLESNLKKPTNEEMEDLAPFLKDGQFHERALKAAASDSLATDLQGSESALGRAIGNVGEGIHKMTPVNFIVPVWQTTWNMLRQLGHRTPMLWRFSSEMTKDMKSVDPARRDAAMAKLYMGRMLYLVGIGLYLGGKLNPMKDPDKKAAFKTAGPDADSLTAGDTAYSLQNAWPVGNIWSLTGRVMYAIQNSIGVDTDKNKINLFDQSMDIDPETVEFLKKHTPVERWGPGGQHWDIATVGAYLLAATTAAWSDSTANRQLKEIQASLAGDRGVGMVSRLTARTAVAMTVPFSSAIRAYTNAPERNPYLREAHSFLDYYLMVVAPTRVDPKFDLLGKPMVNYGKEFLGTVAVSPGKPLSSARREIGYMEAPIQEMLDDEWRDVKLTPAERLRWNQLVGTIKRDGMDLEEYLSNEIDNDPGYQDLVQSAGAAEPGTKARFVMTIIKSFRQEAFAEMQDETDERIYKEREKNLENPVNDYKPPKEGDLGIKAFFYNQQP